MSEPVAIRLEIEGRVQGVGYRDWLLRHALHEGVDGWVRNRRDGSVEVLLSGSPDAVEVVAAACARGPMLARVDRVRRHVAEALPGGSGFERRPTL